MKILLKGTDIMNFSAVDVCRQGVYLTADRLSRDIYEKGRRKRILDSVSFSAVPGELIAVIGSSGSGKSTLINCLNGFEPATDGAVYINGKNLLEHYDAFKSEIGYVSQSEAVHDRLSVYSMLRFTARLRLDSEITSFEIEQRIADALRILGLTEHRHKLIKKLSGGQRKRACIAAELISDPSLFFLDEPTSGLDPEAEASLMKQLRLLAHKKRKTVICITHTLQSISLFDKIIFLAPGGRLCFFGTLTQALDFFKVDSLSDAYELIRRDPQKYVHACSVLSGEAVRL